MADNRKLKCPKCGKIFMGRIETNEACIICRCPGCDSNVAIMQDKRLIISDKLLEDLINKRRLKHCGFVFNYDEPRRKKAISKEDITDLKILLETENNIDKIISRL